MKRNDKQRLFEVMGRLDKTFKPKLNEDVIPVEKPELDEPVGEGASYKAKLEEIVKLAQQAYENLPDSELPAWVQDKIVVAKVHLNDIVGFLHTGEEHEETEEKGEFRKMDDEEGHPVKPEEKEEEKEEEPEEKEEKPEGEEEKEEPEEEKKPKVPVVDIAKANK